MKNKLLQLLLLFIFAFFIGKISVQAQGFPWQDFKSRNLKEIAAMEKDVEQRKYDRPIVVFHGDMMFSKVEVVYTGEIRSMTKTKSEMLATWAKTYTKDGQDYNRLYESDMLFTEGNDSYWLPVQKQVIPYFAKELKKGDKVCLYLVRAGGIYNKTKDKDQWDWLLLVEEFQTPEKAKKLEN